MPTLACMTFPASERVGFLFCAYFPIYVRFRFLASLYPYSRLSACISPYPHSCSRLCSHPISVELTVTLNVFLYGIHVPLSVCVRT